jgi:hypothetical protein
MGIRSELVVGSPMVRGLLIFEPVLTDSASKPYDGLPVRRETLANPTDWKSVVQWIQSPLRRVYSM